MFEPNNECGKKLKVEQREQQITLLKQSGRKDWIALIR